MTVIITDVQREALGYALDLAADDQHSYLSIGNPHVDYGSEWPRTARWKAGYFRAIAEFAGPFLPGETDRWNGLADAFEASAREAVCDGNA